MRDRPSPARRWQRGLLLPFPPLSLLYLLAVRAQWIAPAFPPLLLLAALPLASIGAGVAAARGGEPPGWLLLAVAVAELVWAGLALAMVGFAIAWRSG